MRPRGRLTSSRSTNQTFPEPRAETPFTVAARTGSLNVIVMFALGGRPSTMGGKIDTESALAGGGGGGLGGGGMYWTKSLVFLSISTVFFVSYTNVRVSPCRVHDPV